MARIDGCSEFYMYRKIIPPLSTGPISALTIYAFHNVWGFFTWLLIIMTTMNKYTTELGLATSQNQFFIEYSLVTAGATMTAPPFLLVYFVFRRRIIAAIALTVLKGTQRAHMP